MLTSVQTNAKYCQNYPFHIYLDLDAVNNSNTGLYVPLKFKDIRKTSILQNPQEYFFSIVRFNIQTTGFTLPVFIPLIKLGQTDPNLTAYILSIGPNDYPITYVPQDATQSIPNQPLLKQDLSTSYYYVYNYQYFLDIVNSTLAAGWLASGEVTPVPFFKLDPSTLNITFCYPITGTSPIAFNDVLYDLFSTLKFTRSGANNYVLEYDEYSMYTIAAPFSNPGNFYTNTSENSPLSQWNPVKDISFLSREAPIIQTQIAPIQEYGSTQSFNQNGSVPLSASSNINPIVSDFIVPFGGLNQTYKPYIEYSPNVYRLLDLYGNSPITSIEIDVFWKDNWNNLHPVVLAPNCCAGCKVMFRRKDFNTNSKNIL